MRGRARETIDAGLAIKAEHIDHTPAFADQIDHHAPEIKGCARDLPPTRMGRRLVPGTIGLVARKEEGPW
ncbi:MAG: hypothetical protein AAGF74_14260 [Pseudomonadota bacterium]